MPAQLRQIRNFDQLVRYLEDELDWPLNGYDFEDLTFEYQPAELGLKSEAAARVRTIRQLRPFSRRQPWGIFFIEFDKRKLPVVLLRTILSHLVVKKRASANRAERSAWNVRDLLFISAFGEEEDDGREIAFAHFHQENGDLPTLRVVGWDGADTPLKLAHVHQTLVDRLRFLDGESPDEWRERWSSAFRHRPGHVINTADLLAREMARLARGIRDKAITKLDAESEDGPLTKLFRAFQTALIHDLTPESFADTYAQTITYGLFTAAVSRTDMSDGGGGTVIVPENVIDMVPVTNPILREMLQTFLTVGGRAGDINFDELGIQDVADLLRDEENTDIRRVVIDFGNRRPGEDPVIHFYEHFLNAYNKKLKVQRGVFYTPQPVVSYIVRSVHELLQTEFGLEYGLADTTTWGEMLKKHPDLKLPPLTDEPGEERTISPDEPFVQILDPATGTATFLVEVIDVIHRHLKETWSKSGPGAVPRIGDRRSEIGDRRSEIGDRSSLAEQGVSSFIAYWNQYVPRHLLPRLHAFELMMAPYAIAHMKIGLKLAETGYRFGTEERARIYLTNALEPWVKQLPLIGFDALAHEAEAVNEIKRYKRFTVVIGNPPYANYSANLSREARRIVDKYRNFQGVPIRERNQLQFERNIQDDFVKFISIAQDFIQSSGVGALGYITNGTMLASASLRGMRENFIGEFSSLFELNLHGGGNEIIAGAEDDENVFDIIQSVAIHLCVRFQSGGASEVNYADLLGRRLMKYEALASLSVKDTEWRKIQPDPENCGFTPQDEDNEGGGSRLDSAFVQFGAGIKTNRDTVVIGFDDKLLIEAVRGFNAELVSENYARNTIHSLLYRPFDVRRIFYHEGVVASRSLPTMKHVVAGPNIGFVCSSTWTTPERFSVGVSRLMVEMKSGTHDRGTTYFPLYRYESFIGGNVEQVHNLTPEFVREWSATTQTQFIPTGHGNWEENTGPEDVLFWLYGLFYSPQYRRRYRSALSQGFPIILLSSNLELFRALARLGGELTALHLLESPRLDQPLTRFIGDNPVVSKVGWTPDGGGTVWVDATGTRARTNAGTSGFRPVPENVWNFHIGGYQVCEKWLKDRKSRTLSADDIAHYHKIVIALTETIRLMAEIDQVIEEHGGWPGAFHQPEA